MAKTQLTAALLARFEKLLNEQARRFYTIEYNMNNLLNGGFLFDDPVAQRFRASYAEGMETLKTKLLPAMEKYQTFLFSLAEKAGAYTENSGVFTGDSPSIAALKKGIATGNSGGDSPSISAFKASLVGAGVVGVGSGAAAAAFVGGGGKVNPNELNISSGNSDWNSKHFSLKEFTRTSRSVSNEPDDIQKANLQSLVTNVLDPTREATGMPITVSSGFRSEELNRKIGGSNTSWHSQGKAADLKSKNNAFLFNTILKSGNYTELIWEEGNTNQPAWVHVAYDPKKINKDNVKVFSNGKLKEMFDPKKYNLPTKP